MMAQKVNFKLSADVVAGATAGLLLGDFNNWNAENGISLKKQKDGSMKTSLELEGGKSYQYRYLLNDGRWVNDSTADQYAYATGFQVENCVVAVPAESEEKPVKEKAAKAVKAPKEVKPAKEKVAKIAKAVKESTPKTKTKKEKAAAENGK